VTLPVPASTDPVADAAAHIAALADAIAARVGSRSAGYYSGTVTSNASGDFPVPGITGVLSMCTGAVVTDNGFTPHLFTLVVVGAPGTAKVRARTYSGAAVGATTLDVCVIAFGTPA
jgi:hypothetical protein